jgi:hypothetical protein
MSDYTLEAQQAKAFFNALGGSSATVPQITVGKSASGTGSVVIAHGYGAAPDFAIFNVGANANALTWSATTTSITLVGRSATTAAIVSYIFGNMS